MCKTIETSIATLLVVAYTSYILYPTKPFVASVVMLVGSMQAVDVLLWISIKNKLHALNRMVSTFLIPAIFMVQITGGYYFSQYRNRLFEWLILCIILTTPIWWSVPCNATSVDKSGYLRWCDFDIGYPNRLGYLFMITFPIIMGMGNGYDKYVILLSIYGMFILNWSEKAFGSRWCWSANIMSLLLLSKHILSCS
jgi:hypothetical protein